MSEAEPRKLRYISFGSPIGDADRARAQASELYKLGDTVLIWCNEGDLCMVGECLDKQEPTIDQLKAENAKLRTDIKVLAKAYKRVSFGMSGQLANDIAASYAAMAGEEH